MPSFTLVFDGVPVAAVVEEDCDLLAIMGSYALLEGVREEPDLREAVAWHDACVARAALRSEGRGEGLEASDAERGDGHGGSSRWALVGATGERRPIVFPRFLTGGKITWGWAE